MSSLVGVFLFAQAVVSPMPDAATLSTAIFVVGLLLHSVDEVGIVWALTAPARVIALLVVAAMVWVVGGRVCAVVSGLMWM